MSHPAPPQRKSRSKLKPGELLQLHLMYIANIPVKEIANILNIVEKTVHDHTTKRRMNHMTLEDKFDFMLRMLDDSIGFSLSNESKKSILKNANYHIIRLRHNNNHREKAHIELDRLFDEKLR